VWLPHEAVGEHLVPSAADAPAQPAPSQADELPGFCPRCRGILQRARVTDENPFHLDRCPACRGIWFDAGEWAAVASTEWLHHLDDLWDPVWRKKVRDERADNRHLESIESALGPAAFSKVQAAIDALREHPNRSLALSFLVEELSGPRK
jgi:Zn-finger nucleic acid-binding protein